MAIRPSKIGHFYILTEKDGYGFLVVFTVLNQVAMISLNMIMHSSHSQAFKVRMQTTIESHMNCLTMVSVIKAIIVRVIINAADPPYK